MVAPCREGRLNKNPKERRHHCWKRGGGLLIRDLWTQGTDIIRDMRFVNTDAVSYQSNTRKKCLQTADHEKKKKYLHACLNECLHFTTFVDLVDSLLGVEAELTLKRIASRLTQKWKELYSRTFIYVKSRMAITIVRATHRCIWGGQGSGVLYQLDLPPVERWC